MFFFFSYNVIFSLENVLCIILKFCNRRLAAAGANCRATA